MKALGSFFRNGFDISRSKAFLLVAIVMMVIGGSTPVSALTYTVGTGGNYANLTTAFTAINGGTISGSIILQLTTTQALTATASLNASGSGLANYTSVVIYPTVAGITISGSIANAAIINLNGADNVTLDGRVNQTGTTRSLIISNTRTNGYALRYIADASTNTVKYCTLKGVTTTAAAGVVFFSSGTTTGNDNNLIDYCDICSGTTQALNTVYSAGTSTAIDNSNNVVSNSNIYDFFSVGSASNGIFIASNSSAWSITANRFYQTATRTPTTGRTHHAINIVTASGINYTVSTNIIGYSNNTGTGLTTYGGGVTSLYRAIELTVGTATPSSIQGNTISGMSFSTTSGSTTSPGIFTGISILAGSVNIGTTTGNTIGSATGTGAITVTSTTTLGYLAGICSTSAGTVTIQNNSIGGISTGGTVTMGYSLFGINTKGTGSYSMIDNTIGSTSMANSIAVGTTATTTPVCTFNGISNAATGTISMTGNVVQNCTVYGTAASVFNGIANTAGTGTLNMTGNSVISGTNKGTGAMTCISNTAAVTTLNINNNFIRNHSRLATTGVFTAISNTGAVTSAININSNQLGNVSGGLINYGALNSSTLTGISNTGGAAAAALSIQSNDIQGITYTSSGTHNHNYLYNTAATLSQNISSNTFTNLIVNTTGSIFFITNNITMPANGVQNINGNSIVTGFSKTGAGGNVNLFTSNTATNNANVTVNNNMNNFSNITVTGATTIDGWINTDAGTGSVTKTIDGNTFGSWTGSTGTITALNVNITSANNAVRNNTINTISTAANINGITTGAGNDNIYSNTIHTLISSGGTSTLVNGISITNGTLKNVYLNTIYNLQANNITTGSVNGISVSGGTTNSIYRNKIYAILSNSSGITTGTVNGILVSGAVANQTTTILNNTIGDIRAAAANATNPICGIRLTNAGTTSANVVYYNTIQLNATSTGLNFGSSGIYHTTSTTATTGTLDLINNIVVNTSTAIGTGTTVAFRRSSGAAGDLNNYASTSNNNLFYTGLPSLTNHFLYSDGTSSAQTIASYKAATFTAGVIAPRDQASISENPAFISTVGSSIDFLKINPATVTFIESGATNIVGITTDFDSDIRAGNVGYPAQVNGFGTSPDIGADEFDGKQPSVVIFNSNEISDGNYPDLRTALSGINAQSQTGKSISVSVLRSTTETASAALNAGVWTSLTVYPTVAGITIGGNIAAPLVDLNGADNVTIDGRVNQTGTTVSLSIDNSSTVATTGTSTIRFINSAETNTIKYCTLKGSTTSTTDGILTFSTSTAGNGNDNNLIDNNVITCSGVNRPLNALYSNGSSGRENNPNTISNTSFYNFLNASASSNGINIGAFSSDWIVSANQFYETTAFVPTSGTWNYCALRIDNASGNNFSISGNYIGGQATLCGGAAWSVNAATNHNFSAISLNVGTSTASSIQNNFIRNWSYRSAHTTPWIGIQVLAGATNIGTVTANTIGSNTGTGSITLTATADAESYGVQIGSAGTVEVSKNQIGSINLVGNATNVSHGFAAIYKSSAAGTLTLANNIIGSTATANSIYASSTATTSTTPQRLTAILTASTGTASLSQNTIANLNNAYAGTLYSRTRGIYATAGVSTISKNTIRNLSSASLGANGSVAGIELTATGATNTIADNTIYALSNSGATYAGYVAGILLTGNTVSNLLNANFIRTLSVNAASTTASLYGIRIESGAATCTNNIISLGGTTATTIYGIYENGAATFNNTIYFNSVSITGTLGSGITNKSYALFSNASTNIRDFRNNLFSNTRSTTGGASIHYAAYFNYTTTSNLTLDYNDYYTPGVGGVLGYFNGSNQTTVPIVSTMDANSMNVNPLFTNAGGLNAIDYKITAPLNGDVSVDISHDYELISRGLPPNLGAFEFYTNRWIGSVSTDFGNALNWSASSVPVAGSPIVFEDAPLNSCILDMNRSISNISNTQSTYKFMVNGKQLTINGALYLNNGAQIDAKTASSTIIFAGSDVQTIPDGSFVDNTILNLTINNVFGVTSESDLIVDNVLNLLSPNPSDVQGCLDVATTKTLTLSALSSIIGDGDVSGVVRRTSFAANTEYAFNNKYTKVKFGAIGTLPTEVSYKLTLGAAPIWKSTALNRVYEFKQTGGSNCFADVTLGYLQSELNGNDESKLAFWNASGFPTPTVSEWGYSANETTLNWLSIKEMPINLWATAFGTKEFGIAASENPEIVWNGTTSTTWGNANNWTPVCFPNKYTGVTIPNAGTTTFDPTIPVLADINSVTIQNAGILNVSSGTVLNVHASQKTGWSNVGGTFNPGNSSVAFNSANVSITGTTNFNNINILSGSSLTPLAGNIMRIAGVFGNLGTLNARTNANTIEYNGSNQTILSPNGALAGYYSLALSNSGAKTLPASPLIISGDLTLSGTVSVAPSQGLTVGGIFTVGSGTTFTAGTLTHHFGGNILNNGGTVTLTGSSILLDGTTNQTIGGSASTTFNNLTINNAGGITLGLNETVGGVLNLTQGLLTTNANSLTLTGTGTISGGSSSCYINGKLALTYTGIGSKQYPIGKGGNYRPLTLQLSALTGSTILTAEQFEGTLPGTLPAKTYLFGTRYWQITQSGGSGISHFVTLDGTGWNRAGTPKIVKGNGVTNLAYDITGTSPYINSTAFTSFGFYGLGETSIAWNGSVDNDWFSAANWSSEIVPTGSLDIIIPSSLSTYPVISGTSPGQDVTIANATTLTINNGASLTLESGPVLTFASGSTVTTGTGAVLTLHSGARYLNLSTSTPTLEVQQTLSGAKGWRMVASPVAGTFSDLFKAPLVTQGFTGSDFPPLQPNLLWWLESDLGTTLQSWRKPTNLTDTLVAGRGYFHYVFDGAGRLNVDGAESGLDYTDVLPTPLSVTGIEPYNGTGTYNFNLTYTTKSSSQTPSPTDTIYYDLNALDQGWNLIGNPTASTLNWDAPTGWTKTNVDNTIYVWDPSALGGNGDYLTWNGTTGTLGNGKIPPFQAFWIHAKTAPMLLLNNAAKTSSTGTFLRSAQADEMITLPLTLSVGNYQTTSYLSFSNNGVTGPDPWDGYKLEPMNDNWLSIYTLSSPSTISPLVINHLPMLDEDMIDIPLYCTSQSNGEFTYKDLILEWKLPENWPLNWDISLQDHRNEQALSMTQNTLYEFKSTSENTLSAKSHGLPLPNKLVKGISETSLLRSSSSLPPFSIVISKGGTNIEYMPSKPQLLGSFPNPFKKQSSIRFSLPQKAKVHLYIYTSQGLKIATLADGFYPAGITEITWDAKNNAPGLYFIRFLSGDTVETKKAILIN